jgi:hypothetical protein
VLERVILEALGGKQAIEARLRAELERLLRGGYLSSEEVERVTREALAAIHEGVGALEGGASEAGARLRPLGEQAARALRELLDVPSRAELEALRAAVGATRPAAAPEPRPER